MPVTAKIASEILAEIRRKADRFEERSATGRPRSWRRRTRARSAARASSPTVWRPCLVLAGEISLSAAITAGHFSSAHATLGRKKPRSQE